MLYTVNQFYIFIICSIALNLTCVENYEKNHGKFTDISIHFLLKGKSKYLKLSFMRRVSVINSGEVCKNIYLYVYNYDYN